MTAFALLSPAVRATFALWALLLLLVNLFSAVLSAVRRRLRCALLALLSFAPIYFLWQVIFDLSLFGNTERAAAVSRRLGALPWIVWLPAFALLALGSALLLAYIVRYDRSFITPATVKRYLDRLPCGICCWRKNGSVIFSNVLMNRLCKEMTGGPLLNGNAFRSAASGGILQADGRVWRFSCRELIFGGESLQEMIASDITAEHAKTQALERDKEELSFLNRELTEYYDSIDDAVRREELLQAQILIHDEMNRLMLTTTAADGGKTEELDRIFSLWEQNALLLGKTAEEEKEAADRAEQLAAALGIRLILPDALPETLTEEQRSLFRTALSETIVNAAKHAEAKTVTVSFSETERAAECRFANDGTPPSRELRFTGGLANLSLLAQKQGASVSVDRREGFALLLRFPKEWDTHQPIG